MSRIPLIAGNWKMNKTAADAAAFTRELKAEVGDAPGVEVLVCPTFTSLAAAAAEARGSVVAVGAQNLHWEASGAFTGEVSAEMLLEIPVSHVIIGHSERREYFAETDTTVNLRLKAALAAGLIPIVCVGERLEQRENGETEAVVTTQVRDGLAGLSVQDMARVVIAYEPVWAIGTGRTATPEQAQDVHALIRCLLTEGFGAEVADSVRILYGGSVKPANSLELLGQPDIDGALVGGASLQVADFAAIVRSAATAADA